ncbi:MAG: hypothetical protein M0T79_09595 [Actinomycetota bacterium]|nr:hypothetical protein [Actinomycetota bacterium]
MTYDVALIRARFPALADDGAQAAGAVRESIVDYDNSSGVERMLEAVSELS